MARITKGYKPAANALGWGGHAFMAGHMRGTTFAGHAKPVWIIKLGGMVGRFSTGTPTGRFAAFLANASTWVPGAKAVETGTVSWSQRMIDAYGGGKYELKVTAPYLHKSGPLTLAALGTGAAWAHGQDNSGATMHEREGLASFPATFASTDSRPEGNMALWYVAIEDEKPTIPRSTLLPAENSTIIDDTPTIGADFRCATEILEGFALGQGDKVKQYQLQVWNDARTVKLWDSGVDTATPLQQSARRVGDIVSPALTPARYTARAQVTNLADTKSDWVEWKFTVVGAGAIELTSPTGRTNDTTPDIGWSYTHRMDLAMDRLILRITSPTGTIVRADADFDFSVDPVDPSTGTMAWIDTGWTALPAGADYLAYGYAVDTDGQPSPLSAPLAFHVNAAPLEPTLTGPADGSFTLSLPRLTATVSDPDDTSATMTVVFHVQPVGGLEETAAATYEASSGEWFFDLATAGVIGGGAYDEYEWWVTATDPWGLASPVSDVRSFNYVEPPIVTPTAPIGSTSVSNPPFSWTVDTAQTDYRLRLFLTLTGAPILNADSGWVSSPLGEHSFPDILLRNGQDITAHLDVITTGGIPGSAEWAFTVAYTPPDSLGTVVAEAVQAAFDYPGNPTMIDVSWPESLVTEGFAGYVVRRRDMVTGELEDMALLPAITSTSYQDDTARSGRSYTYEVSQRVYVDLDLLESVPDTDQASVTLKTTVLSVVIGGEGRAVLPYWRQRGIKPVHDKTVRQTWAPKPRVTVGPTAYRTISGEFGVINDPYGQYTAPDLIAAVHNLAATWQDADLNTRPKVLCYRDGIGNVAYVVLMEDPEDHMHGNRGAVMALDMTEVSFTRGGS